MKYILNKKAITIFAGLLVMTTMAGCSTSKKFTHIDNITIEKVSSMDAKIIQADLYKTGSNNILLRGKLKRQFFVRNAQVPGYLCVELFDLKGNVFKDIEFNYGRKSANLNYLSFSILVPVEAELISKVRVIHCQTSSRVIDSDQSLLRVLNPDN